MTHLEIRLIGFQHSIEPIKQLLGTVVTVKDDRDAVVLGHQPDVLSSSNGAKDSSLLLFILDALTGKESGTTVAELNDDGGPAFRYSKTEAFNKFAPFKLLVRGK